jgi:hypothetical protein
MKRLTSSDLAIVILRAERMGHGSTMLVCRRAGEPRRTVRLLPGVIGEVVGTERDVADTPLFGEVTP